MPTTSEIQRQVVAQRVAKGLCRNTDCNQPRQQDPPRQSCPYHLRLNSERAIASQRRKALTSQ